MTRAANYLVKVMHSSLVQACHSGNPDLVRAVCNAVLDMAHAMQAIPPVLHQDRLKVRTFSLYP